MRHGIKDLVAGGRRVGSLTTALGLTLGLLSGCQVLPHSPLEQHLAHVPESERSHVYVYLVEPPTDMAHNGQLHEIARRLHNSGYHNAEYFSMLQDGGSSKLAERVRLAREQDADARILLVGWSNAATTVLKSLKELDQDSIVVDRVIYLDSDELTKETQQGGHPQNVTRVVLAYRPQTPLPPGIPHATHHMAAVRSHREVPTSPAVYNILLGEVHEMSLQPATAAAMSRAANPHGVQLTSFPKSMRTEVRKYKGAIRH